MPESKKRSFQNRKLSSVFVGTMFLSGAVLFFRYLSANSHKFENSFFDFPRYASALFGFSTQDSDCLALSVGSNGAPEYCINGIKILEDGALARNLSVDNGSSFISETISFNSKINKRISINQATHTQIKSIPCGFRDYTFVSSPPRKEIACKGTLLAVPSIALKHAIVEVAVEIHSNSPLVALEQIKPVFYLSSQATIASIDRNAWGWFARELHREPLPGDPIFLQNEFQFTVGSAEKMPFVGKNRSIFAGVGAWPGDAKTLRLISAEDLSIAGEFDQYPREGLLLARELVLKSPQEMILKSIISLPTNPEVDSWFVGIKGSSLEQIEITGLNIKSLSNKQKAYPLFHVSPVVFDVVVALLKKGYCTKTNLTCIRNIVKHEIPKYI